MYSRSDVRIWSVGRFLYSGFTYTFALRLALHKHRLNMRFSNGVLDVVMIFLTIALRISCTGTHFN